jgi:hypothetical protein
MLFLRHPSQHMHMALFRGGGHMTGNGGNNIGYDYGNGRESMSIAQMHDGQWSSGLGAQTTTTSNKNKNLGSIGNGSVWGRVPYS